MKFNYQALNAAGKVVSDVIETKDAADAIEQLRRRGMFVTEIAETSRGPIGGGAGGVTSSHARVGRGKRLKCLAMFARQLHVLVATGIPLTQSLEALERQVPPSAWHDVLADLRSRVE